MPKVQVDKGAIKFVLSGADIMCPGLTSAGGSVGPELKEGAIVVCPSREADLLMHLITLALGHHGGGKGKCSSHRAAEDEWSANVRQFTRLVPPHQLEPPLLT